MAAVRVQRVYPDGTQAYEPVARLDAASGRWEAVPVDFGAGGDPVYLLLFGTGIRQAGGVGQVRAYVGGIATTVSYASPQGVYKGLDQVNLLLPSPWPVGLGGDSPDPGRARGQPRGRGISLTSNPQFP